MKTNKKVIAPKVVAGGAAIPLGKNFYYMTGKKHKDGGIDVGNNPKTGLEVEDGEVMHLTNNEAKVFSSVPFLNGESPADKVMNGNNPTQVFNAQERYKDRKGIKDDGTKKALGGGVDLPGRKKGDPNLNPNDRLTQLYKQNPHLAPTYDGTPDGQFITEHADGTIGRWGKDYSLLPNEVVPLPVNNTPRVLPSDKSLNTDNSYNPARDRQQGRDIPTIKSSTGRNRYKVGGSTKDNRKKYDTGGSSIYGKNIMDIVSNNKTLSSLTNTGDFDPNTYIVDDPANPNPNWLQRTGIKIGNAFSKGANSISNYYKENPGVLNDSIGLASNVVGSIISNNANNSMLNKLKYADAPVSRQAAKLKTTININPQLDKMRESAAAYERDINDNTASSRVALARKQQNRVANILDTNQLYGDKENAETQLINRDKLNQQQVADANIQDYNQWARGKADFNNTIAEKRSENKVGLIENINAGIQDILTRSEKRSATKDNMLAIAASHPDVNPMILKQLGVTSITDKMISDWNKANLKKTKKSQD